MDTHTGGSSKRKKNRNKRKNVEKQQPVEPQAQQPTPTLAPPSEPEHTPDVKEVVQVEVAQELQQEPQPEASSSVGEGESTAATTGRSDALELILYEMRSMNHKMTSIEEWQHQQTQRSEVSNTTTAALSTALAEGAKVKWEIEKAQLLAEVTRLTQKCSSLEEESQHWQTQHNDQKAKLAQNSTLLATTTKNLEAHLSTLTSGLEEYKLKEKELISENKLLQEKVAMLQEQGAQAKEHQLEVDKLKESHQSQRDQVVELLKKLEDLQEDFDNEIRFKEDSIRGLNNEIKRMEEERSIEGSLLSTEMQKLKEQNATYQTTLAEKDKENAELVVQLDVHKNKVSELEAIADILNQEKKTEAEDLLCAQLNLEVEGATEDLILKLEKLSHGSIRVKNFNSLENTGSADFKLLKQEIDPVYLSKIIKTQSIVRRHFARKRYKNIKRRAAIAREIFSTEKAYVKHLNTVHKVFVHPLREKALTSVSEGFPAMDKLQAIFSTLEFIMKANFLLLKKLSQATRSWNYESLIGNVFVEMLPLLEPHVDYIINYENAQNTLRTIIRESRTFSQFLRVCLKNPELDCKDLHDFLIMPVQRIPRYVMLIHDLQKNTPITHPDHSALLEALVKMKQFADSINERKRAHDRVFQIKDNIIGFKDLDANNRFLIFEGDLKTKKYSEHFFLFNDMLLCCRAESKKWGSSDDGNSSLRYKFLSKIMIDANAKVEDSKDAKYPNAFILIPSDHITHTFTASSPEEKAKWVTAIGKAILHSPNSFSLGHNIEFNMSSPDLRASIM